MQTPLIPSSAALSPHAGILRRCSSGSGFVEAALRVTVGIVGLVVSVATCIGIVTWRAVDRRVESIAFHNEILRNDARLRDAAWEFQEYLDIHSHGRLEANELSDAWRKFEAEMALARKRLGELKSPRSAAAKQHLQAAEAKIEATWKLALEIHASAWAFLRRGEDGIFWFELHETLHHVEPAVDSADKAFELTMRAFAAESGFSPD